MTLEKYIDSLNLRHFKGAEFAWLWTRTRQTKSGLVSNSPPPLELWDNIVPTLVVLDELRARVAHPMRITSAYRSPDYNRAVGGARFSQHLLFNAVDVTCAKVAPAVVGQIAKTLRGRKFTDPLTGARFVFRGGIGIYKTFIHLDTRGHDADWE